MKKKYSTLPTADKMAKLLDFVDEHKAKNPVVLNLTHQNTFAESMLVISASSVRHAQSLAENISTFCKHENLEFLHMEGKQLGQWILLDLNDIVINIFQESVRDLYNLEALWAEMPQKPIENNS